MKYIKIYGAKRTCTNFITWALRNNFLNVDLLVNELGWKHQLCEPVDWSMKNWCDEKGKGKPKISKERLQKLKETYEDKKVRYVIVVKNPVSWYLSILRYEGKKKKRIDISILQRYIKKYIDWLSFLNSIGERGILIRYEILLSSFEYTLDSVQKRFDLKRLYDPYIKPEKRFFRANLTKRNFDSSYYTDNKFLDQFDKKDLEVFNKMLPKDLMRGLGYAYF